MQKNKREQIKIKSDNKQNCSQLSNNTNISSIYKNHPSYQSYPKNFKPSIKVGYKVIPNSRNENNQNQLKSGRRQIKKQQKITSQQIYIQHPSRVKIIDTANNQYNSGKFVGSQYCKSVERNDLKNSRNSLYNRAKVEDARNKYQISTKTQSCIKGQFIQKREPSCFSNSRQNKSKTQISEIMSLSRSKYNSKKQKQISSRENSNHNLSNNRYENQIRKLPSYSEQGIKDIIQYWHAGQYKQQKVTQKCNKTENDIKSKYAKFNEIHEFDFRKKIRQIETMR